MDKFIKYELTPKHTEFNQYHGQFEIRTLESGYGITIGNALRRVLLSSIPGAAVFAIKIPGVKNEFEAMDGIKEDVAQIILNLKLLVLKISPDAIAPNATIETWPTLKLSVKEEGVIKAGDIELPVGFEVVNPELYICTKTKSTGKFEMEVYATTGRGFRTFKQNQEHIKTLGIIATDSNFSPVLQVGVNVDEVKVTKDQMGDVLTMNIVTNGAISSNDAVAYASKILLEHFEPLADINQAIKNIQMMQEKQKEEAEQTLSISIDDLELSERSSNCLKRHGVKTLLELSNMTREEVKNIKNLGKKSLVEIQKKLADYGLSFKK